MTEPCGKRCLVVGGTGGIGNAIAVELEQGGAEVAVIARRTDARARSSIGGPGKRFTFEADITDAAAFSIALARAQDALEGLDIVVHAAGGRCSGDISSLSLDDWRTAMALHLDSVFLLSRSVMPMLRQGGGGSILFVSSAAASRAPADAIAYSTAKAAVEQFARCLAIAGAPDRIRVNCIAPGFVDTPFHEEMSAPARALVEERIPLRRLGDPVEVARLARAILTNDYVTGLVAVVDGGLNLNFR